jgi:hypothetical protein
MSQYPVLFPRSSDDVDPRSLLLDRSGDGYGFVLVCPRCGFEYQHAKTPSRIPARLSHGQRAGLLIPISGECGHEWAIALDNYKGYEVLSVVSELDPDKHVNTENVETLFVKEETSKRLHKAGWSGLDGKLIKATVRQASGPDGAYDHEIEGYIVEIVKSGAEDHLLIHSKQSDRWRMVRVSAVIELEVFKESK